MAGYRRVNYYELCRLCTSSDGTKMHIFREEGRRRQLTYKIQTCLPLQVQEEDSLPKIICSTCVERLESFYEFREACVNAEAMLESYFTSLKYSDDLTREGKVSVYVKDEVPKKKDEPTATKIKLTTNESTTTGLHQTAIQILTDADGNPITQYKVQLPSNLSTLVPGGAGLPLSLTLPALHPVNKPQQQLVNSKNSRSDEMTQTISDGNQQQQQQQMIPPPPPLVAALTITPSNQDVLQRLTVNSKDSSAMSRFTELLKMKNISIVDASSFESMSQLQANLVAQASASVASTTTTATGPVVTTTQPQQQAQIRIDASQLIQTTNNHIQQQQQQQNMLPTRGRKPEEKNRNEHKHQEQSNMKTEAKQEEEEDDALQNLEDEMDDVTVEISRTDDSLMYGCALCGKTFKKKEHLFQHRKSHSGERPFICTSCGKAFSRKEHLLRHNVSHTGQKMYSCDVCMKSFSRKDNLHKHKKTHGINGPHVCDICGKSFVVKHYYVLHKQTHENLDMSNVNGTPVKNLTSSVSSMNPLQFKCDLCVKSFSSKQYLETHRLRHRNKHKNEKQVTETEQQQQQAEDVVQQQQTILTGFTPSNINLATLNSGLTTINPNALLAPSIIHPGPATNMLQIGNTSFLCTTIEQYRRLHNS